jgi:hypothetical protein
MQEFFSQLTGPEKVIFFVTLPFTIWFIIKLVMTIVGLDSDGADVDLDVDIDTDVDVEVEDGSKGGFNAGQYLTIKNMVNFMTFFGWGTFFFQKDLNLTLSIIGAFILATIFTAGLNMLFIVLLKFQEDNTENPTDAIGKNAKVYLTVPERGCGEGKIEVVVGGRKQIKNAVSGEFTHETGKTVQVVDYENGCFIVD